MHDAYRIPQPHDHWRMIFSLCLLADLLHQAGDGLTLIWTGIGDMDGAFPREYLLEIAAILGRLADVSHTASVERASVIPRAILQYLLDVAFARGKPVAIATGGNPGRRLQALHPAVTEFDVTLKVGQRLRAPYMLGKREPDSLAVLRLFDRDDRCREIVPVARTLGVLADQPDGARRWHLP
ncbi:hypothetical protein C798_26525 [Herbaspirillum rubrisubalbicans Os34]|uniref:Uncharacterized protein n=1 Tax=Herbaspirillum rubrisubalbicans Os34 TaxID=1235827 RepID=A0A6M3ZYB8_9BURK|nr:hypothetical protein C798_26525 [Herbaspirillum rubrisubalbicans Os34]